MAESSGYRFSIGVLLVEIQSASVEDAIVQVRRTLEQLPSLNPNISNIYIGCDSYENLGDTLVLAEPMERDLFMEMAEVLLSEQLVNASPDASPITSALDLLTTEEDV